MKKGRDEIREMVRAIIPHTEFEWVGMEKMDNGYSRVDFQILDENMRIITEMAKENNQTVDEFLLEYFKAEFEDFNEECDAGIPKEEIESMYLKFKD